MYVLQLFNQYRSKFNGEELVVSRTESLLHKYGHRTQLLLRSSRGLEKSFVGKATAFLKGIYSREAYRELRSEIRRDRPDVVHAHNLYPLFSPSVLAACRAEQVPVVVTVHNQGLTCPRADHLFQGKICDRCIGGHDYNCLLHNCRENIFESAAYAIRSTIAKKFRLFHDNVNVFIALSQFARDWLTQAGYDSSRIVVLPNMVAIPDQVTDPPAGQYVAFAGRLSPEKGAATVVEAAKVHEHIEYRMAGDGPQFADLNGRRSKNVNLLGQLPRSDMVPFLRRARCLVVPSVCFEMCPMVILEAMSLGLPVIASRIGGLPELVQDGMNGLLFDPGNPRDLADKVEQLWNSPELAAKLGSNGRLRAKLEFDETRYLDKLIPIYHRAIAEQYCVKAKSRDDSTHDEELVTVRDPAIAQDEILT